MQNCRLSRKGYPSSSFDVFVGSFKIIVLDVVPLYFITFMSINVAF